MKKYTTLYIYTIEVQFNYLVIIKQEIKILKERKIWNIKCLLKIYKYIVFVISLSINVNRNLCSIE